MLISGKTIILSLQKNKYVGNQFNLSSGSSSIWFNMQPPPPPSFFSLVPEQKVLQIKDLKNEMELKQKQVRGFLNICTDFTLYFFCGFLLTAQLIETYLFLMFSFHEFFSGLWAMSISKSFKIFTKSLSNSPPPHLCYSVDLSGLEIPNYQ